MCYLLLDTGTCWGRNQLFSRILQVVGIERHCASSSSSIAGPISTRRSTVLLKPCEPCRLTRAAICKVGNQSPVLLFHPAISRGHGRCNMIKLRTRLQLGCYIMQLSIYPYEAKKSSQMSTEIG